MEDGPSPPETPHDGDGAQRRGRWERWRARLARAAAVLRVIWAEALAPAGRRILGALLGRFAPTVGRAADGLSLAARLGVLLIAANILWLIAAAGVVYVWPNVARLGGDGLWREFEGIADRARGAALFDSEGRYFGVLSASFERDHLGELAGAGAEASALQEADLAPDHKAIPVADAPETFWRCLVFLEDENRGGWDNPYGISYSGFAFIPYRGLWLSLSRGRLTLPRGGSTLEMQLARSLRKQYRHNSNPFQRKLFEWRAAPVLHWRLAREEEGRRFRAWMATHLALIQAAGGEGDVYGVAAAGRLLFGRGAEALSPGQQALLAAAVQRPLRLRASADQRRAELARFIGTEARPGRALRCASDAAALRDGPVIADPAARAAARAELTALASEPFQPPPAPNGLEAAFAPLLAHPGGPRLDPQRIAADLAYGVQVEAAADLADQFARGAGPEETGARPLFRGRMTELRLTVDLAENLALRRAVDAGVRAVEERAPEDRLAAGVLAAPERRGVPLPPEADAPALWRTPLVRETERRAPLLILAADAEGRIVRAISTGGDSLGFGRAATRRNWGFWGEGPYDPALATREMASVGKVGAALLLAEAGLDRPGARVSDLCGRYFTQRCGAASTVSLRRAFAQSRNAAVVWSLAEFVEAERIERFAQALDWRVDESGGEVGGEVGGAGAGGLATPPATRLALGRYAARPVDVLTMMRAAQLYAEGRFDAVVPAPTLIDGLTPFDPVRDAPAVFAPRARAQPTPLAAIARPGPRPERSAEVVADLLASPVCDQGGDGRATLRRLRAWCAGSRADVRAHLAKSGTSPGKSPGSGHNESDWWVAGAITFADGRAYTYVVAAGDGAPGRPFAQDLGGGRLAPVVEALLESLLEDA